MNDAHHPIVGSMPRPLPTGTEFYYRLRAADFARRHPDGQQPKYYLDYGDKCLHQFRAVECDLSIGGRQWVESTLRLLQEAIEQRLRLDPAGFDLLELDDDAFHDFAFSTHAQAYVSGGIFTLPADDLWRILKTPDMTDVVSPDGITEILELLADLDRRDIAHIVEATNDQKDGRRAWRILAWFVRRGRPRSHRHR